MTVNNLGCPVGVAQGACLKNVTLGTRFESEVARKASPSSTDRKSLAAEFEIQSKVSNGRPCKGADKKWRKLT